MRKIKAEAMKMKNFRTSDLSLAAFLMTLDFPLLKTEGNGRRVAFHFPSTADEAAPGYLQGEKVSARAFSAAMRDLKSLIFSQQRGVTRMNMETKENAEYRKPSG